jgi:TonB family protein
MTMPGKTLGKAIALIAALTPTMAAAHCCCCCEQRHHHQARVHRSHHRMVRTGHWETARFQVTAGRPCGNYPVSALRAHASGVTWVKLRVNEDGFVAASRISESSGRRDLDRAALACVAGWHLGAGYEWRTARIVWRFHWGEVG